MTYTAYRYLRDQSTNKRYKYKIHTSIYIYKKNGQNSGGRSGIYLVIFGRRLFVVHLVIRSQ